MGERLLNLTTDKTMEAFEEEYATLTDEDAADTYTRQAMAASRVANRKIVNKRGRERRQGTHGVRFNWNVYDPAVHPTTLPGYLRERLPSLLDDRLAQQAPRKEGTGKLNVSLDVQAENSEGGAHSSPDLSRKTLPDDAVELLDSCLEEFFEEARVSERDSRILRMRHIDRQTYSDIACEVGLSDRHIKRIVKKFDSFEPWLKDRLSRRGE